MIREKRKEQNLFPACAGVIPGTLEEQLAEMPFPRVCGGDPNQLPGEVVVLVFSPRVRG